MLWTSLSLSGRVMAAMLFDPSCLVDVLLLVATARVHTRHQIAYFFILLSKRQALSTRTM